MKQMNGAKKRYFDYLEKQGKMPAMHEEEMPAYAHGGMVEDDDNYDEEMGEESEFDSSGEPHTDDELEDEHPMEYMSRGGRVKRMARGGIVAHPKFASALRKARM